MVKWHSCSVVTGEGGKRRTKPPQGHSRVQVHGNGYFLTVNEILQCRLTLCCRTWVCCVAVQGLAHTVRKQLAGRQGFAAPRHPQSAFAITHYAGQVPPRCRRRPLPPSPPGHEH